MDERKIFYGWVYRLWSSKIKAKLVIQCYMFYCKLSKSFRYNVYLERKKTQKFNLKVLIIIRIQDYFFERLFTIIKKEIKNKINILFFLLSIN
jgi:hypothetical protein